MQLNCELGPCKLTVVAWGLLRHLMAQHTEQMAGRWAMELLSIRQTAAASLAFRLMRWHSQGLLDGVTHVPSQSSF